MVFSFVSLTDPLNLQHSPTHRQAGVFTGENYHHIHKPQLPPPPPEGGAAGGSRPGSLTERARLSNLQKPDNKALHCPRCESTNTKFCYFNNYSLSQPRHYCKNCRRYWTRGGSLRNVPVGGGVGRNKRNSKRTKSPSTVFAYNSYSQMLELGQMNATPPQPPLLHPLHHLGDYISGDGGINFGGTGAANTEFQIGNSSGDGGGSVLVQQLPYLTDFESPTELYPFGSEGVEAPNYGGHIQFRSIFS